MQAAQCQGAAKHFLHSARELMQALQHLSMCLEQPTCKRYRTGHHPVLICLDVDAHNADYESNELLADVARTTDAAPLSRLQNYLDLLVVLLLLLLLLLLLRRDRSPRSSARCR